MTKLENTNYIIQKKCVAKKADKGAFRPLCPNELFQPLFEKYQNNEDFTNAEEYLFGCLVNSLANIVLNNKHFRYQIPEIKDECFSEFQLAILSGKDHFDKNKGSAYAYCFRLAYVAGIHVLEKYNEDREKIKLESDFEDHNDFMAICEPTNFII